MHTDKNYRCERSHSKKEISICLLLFVFSGIKKEELFSLLKKQIAKLKKNQKSTKATGLFKLSKNEIQDAGSNKT